MENIKGQYIWIIGASTGIGYALAQELSARGANLILSARSREKLNALNRELGGRHHVFPADVSDVNALRAVIKKIPKTIPRIDSAIFLAAIYSPHSNERKDIAFIHEMIHVNLGGAFNMVEAVYPYFKKRKKGQIVLCGSVAGYRGLPMGQPYCATKAAIINMAESLKIEMEPYNIDVKLISPGFVRTPLTDKNDFKMPMIIEPEDAARRIADGLTSNAFEIHFPKKFTYMLKLLRILPQGVYFHVARGILKKKIKGKS